MPLVAVDKPQLSWEGERLAEKWAVKLQCQCVAAPCQGAC